MRAHIGALLSGRKAMCGALRKEEFDYLFAQGSSDTISSRAAPAAIMPLTDGAITGPDCRWQCRRRPLHQRHGCTFPVPYRRGHPASAPRLARTGD